MFINNEHMWSKKNILKIFEVAIFSNEKRLIEFSAQILQLFDRASHIQNVKINLKSVYYLIVYKTCMESTLTN